MSILVDLSQVMISNFMVEYSREPDLSVINESLMRHMILNSLRANKVKFEKEFGELVICCDDTHNWRKDIFPYYKAARKRSREESKIDWNAVFEALHKIRDEIEEFFPYPVLRIDRAEADDIIGSICHYVGNNMPDEKILIISGDKDFGQLHRYSNISQFDPKKKGWITNDDPVMFLERHIIKGDPGDGIPNIRSADDIFMQSGVRQKPVTEKMLAKWLSGEVEMTDEERQRYRRNKPLIDLSCVPDAIREEAINKYLHREFHDRSKLFNYFIKKGLKNLMSDINQF